MGVPCLSNQTYLTHLKCSLKNFLIGSFDMDLSSPGQINSYDDTEIESNKEDFNTFKDADKTISLIHEILKNATKKKIQS